MLPKAFILTVLKSLTSCPCPSEAENVNECCVPAFVYRIFIFIRIHFCFCEKIPDLSRITKRTPLHKPGRLVASAADKLDYVPCRFLSQFTVKFYSWFSSLCFDPCPQTSWVHHCFYVDSIFHNSLWHAKCIYNEIRRFACLNIKWHNTKLTYILCIKIFALFMLVLLSMILSLLQDV